MVSLVDELRRREAAARAEAEELRGRIAQLAEHLAGVEEQLSRLVIARETVDEVLSEADTDASPAAGPEVTGPPGPGRPPVTGALAVPPWRAGLEASVLPQAYRDMLEVAEDAGRPLRAVQIAAAAGFSTDKAKVETLRSKLKRLVERGWLSEEAGPGLFTLPAHAGDGTGGAAEPRLRRALLPRFEGANRYEPQTEEEPCGTVCPDPGRRPLRGLGKLVHDAGRTATGTWRGRADRVRARRPARQPGPGGAAAAPARPPGPAGGTRGAGRPRAPPARGRRAALGHPTSTRPMPPCRCQPAGVPMRWPGWPRSKPPAARSRPRTRPSPAAAGR